MSRARDLADGTFSGAFEADSPTLVVDAANNRVGVGTSSPLAKTNSVSAGAALGGTAQFAIGSGTNNFENTYFRIDDSGNSNFCIDQIVGGTSFNRLFIERTTGNVGIGASNPSARLDIRGTSNPSLKVWSQLGTIGNYAELALHSYNNFSGFGQTYIRAVSTASGNSGTALTFATEDNGFGGPVERARIDSSGNLMVGTTIVNPHIVNSGTAVVLSNDGAVKTTNTGPSGLFNRHSSDGEVLRFLREGVDVGSIDVTASATSYNTSSDYRLKENVVPLAGAANRLMQIPVCRFNFIADPDRTVDGFLAHEVQAFVPECVTGEKDQVETVDVKDEDGNVIGTEERPVYQGIDQSKLVPLLTAALQEALADIATLKAEVAALKGSA